MWRSAVLALSTNRAMRQIATRNGLGKRMASRFVAGETIDEAIAVAEDLNQRGATVELDYLGEHVTDEGQAVLAVKTYLDTLDRIANTRVDAHVSLKLSQMGQELGDELCYDNSRKLLERAAEYANFVWLDMEGSDSTERTIQLYKKLRAEYENVGIALQAYLYRSKADVEEILSIGGTVRLCKGAYSEPPEIAFPHKVEVDRNYKVLAEALISSGRYHAIATHDDKMIQHATRFAKARGADSQAFEFQMLYGIRRDLQARLLRDGRRLRIYVPFGEQWFPYFMRRLAERPANTLFLASSIVAEAGSRNRG